jgi:hypothetical protein
MSESGHMMLNLDFGPETTIPAEIACVQRFRGNFRAIKSQQARSGDFELHAKKVPGTCAKGR